MIIDLLDAGKIEGGQAAVMARLAIESIQKYYVFARYIFLCIFAN